MRGKVKLWVVAILVCGTMTSMTSCSLDEDPAGRQDEYAGVPLVIFDTDIGSSTDDLFALEKIRHANKQQRQ